MMSTPDEPAFTSNRTDAESYAAHALTMLGGTVRGLSERRQGYIRDELANAFEEGEHQGLCRALFILGIAERKATDPAVRAALLEVQYLLAPHLREPSE